MAKMPTSLQKGWAPLARPGIKTFDVREETAFSAGTERCYLLSLSQMMLSFSFLFLGQKQHPPYFSCWSIKKPP